MICYLPLAADGDPTRWVVYTLGAISVLYLVFRPWLTRRKDPLDKPVAFGLSQQKSLEREMSNLLVEMSEMARQISGQLDTRAAKLETLIQQAEEKIAELRRLGEQEAVPRREPPAAEAESTPRMPRNDERHLRIYQLADEGRDPQAIARELGRPRGEIELILALRRAS